MALVVEVRNVNSVGAVSAFLDGLSVVVDAGATIGVSPETAGQAPRWRRAETDQDGWPAERVELLHKRVRAGHVEVYDLGSGLLAQPSAWRLAGDDTDPAHPLDAGGGHLVDAWPQPEPVPAPADDDTAAVITAPTIPPAGDIRTTIKENA